jgi:hypothetical protein
VEPERPEPALLSAAPGRLRERLCRNLYFTVERLRLAAGHSFEGACTGTTCEVWGVVGGRAKMAAAGHRLPLPAITFTLLPAVVGPYVVEAAEDAVLLRMYGGEPAAQAM